MTASLKREFAKYREDALADVAEECETAMNEFPLK
jgi:hypothetical protein